MLKPAWTGVLLFATKESPKRTFFSLGIPVYALMVGQKKRYASEVQKRKFLSFKKELETD